MSDPMEGAVQEATALFEQALAGEGQGPESPTGTGGEPGTGASGEGSPTSTRGETGTTTESGTGKEGGEPKDDASKDDESKPPPYDQDPKWKQARAAEKALNELLEEYNFTSTDDLKEALQKGTKLHETELGDDEDIDTLVKEAREYREWKRRQAEDWPHAASAAVRPVRAAVD